MWAEAGGELVLNTVSGDGGFMPWEVVWRHPEVHETCLKAILRSIGVKGDYWDLNGIDRVQLTGGVGGSRWRVGPEHGVGWGWIPALGGGVASPRCP